MSFPILLLVLVIPTLAYSSECVIYVDEVNGHDDSNCLQQQGQPCQSLEYVQHNVKNFTNHSVVIEICNPGINLTAALVFDDFIDLSIRGAEGMNQTTINCNTSCSGLSFFNITGLSLSFLQLTNCGAIDKITIQKPYTYKMLTFTSALYIRNCTDVNISNSTLSMSNGTGISIYDTNGQVVIENTDILESFVRNASSDFLVGGGGLFIEFTNFTSGLVNNEHNSNTIYTICNCKISQNIVNVTTWYQTLSSGGGASIAFASNASNISVTLLNCIFQSNYASHYGGGLRVIFKDSVQNNKVSLIETVFINNIVSLMGGGLQISFEFNLDEGLPDNNIVNLTHCDFKNNTAHNGGGVSVFSSQIHQQDSHSAVYFSNCNWTSNTALFGAAVHIMPGVWASERDGHYPLVVFSNTNILSNKVVPFTEVQGVHMVSQIDTEQALQTRTNGAGAFFCTEINVYFSEMTRFVSNNGTALYLSGSIAKFRPSSHVVFHCNNGTNGGAIALLGRSFLFLKGFTTFFFTNNSATQLGGGLYFQSTSQMIQQPCFIYHGLNSTFIFRSNRAGSGRGHHIYVSSFTSCNEFCKKDPIYDCIGDFFFYDPSNNTNSTATLPTQFNLNSTTTGPFKLFPGFPTSLPLVVKDSENNIVSNLGYEAVLENKHFHINIDPSFKYISNDTINIQGQPEGNATLRLDPSSTGISLLMEIVLVECPPGFVLKNGKCECGDIYYYGILKCDPEAYIQYGTWMGPCNPKGTKLCTSSCPLGYCAYRRFYQPLPFNASLLEDTICSPTRTGTSCGSCKANHSVYYNSWTFECGKEDKCHLGVLFFILSTLIPLTILFLGIIVFDANMVNGWNGFLFFMQIITFLPIYANGVIYFPNLIFNVVNWLWFFYNFSNLDFFVFHKLSFCLWKGATVMDILMVQLGCVFFALSLVFITVFVLKQRKLGKYCPCLLRRRYTVLNGLSAFFILCYARCTWTCFRVLVPTCLNDDKHGCIQVAFYDANLSYFKGAHILYSLVAIIFLLFIVILPAFLLLFYPLFFRILGLCNLSESRAAIFLWKMMPIQLLDSFQNPFKNNCRYFSGLYFLYRAVALAVHVFTDNQTQLFIALEVQFVIMIVLHAAFRPYKKKVHNIIDLLLFFNLALITAITTYNFDNFVGSKSNVVVANYANGVFLLMIVLVVLLCIPLVFATAVVIRKVLKKALSGSKYLLIEPTT